MLQRNVGKTALEKCCREVLYKIVGESVVEKCREVLQRSVGKSVVGKWCRKVVWKSVMEKCCGEVL